METYKNNTLVFVLTITGFFLTAAYAFFLGINQFRFSSILYGVLWCLIALVLLGKIVLIKFSNQLISTAALVLETFVILTMLTGYSSNTFLSLFFPLIGIAIFCACVIPAFIYFDQNEEIIELPKILVLGALGLMVVLYVLTIVPTLLEFIGNYRFAISNAFVLSMNTTFVGAAILLFFKKPKYSLILSGAYIFSFVLGWAFWIFSKITIFYYSIRFAQINSIIALSLLGIAVLAGLFIVGRFFYYTFIKKN